MTYVVVQRQILATSKPFLKWAGGKRQLIRILNENLPDTFGTYFEPFLGGGALLFHMLATRPGYKYRASDLNPDLIRTYVTIRDRIDELIASLRNHEKNYHRDPSTYYYAVRASLPEDSVAKTSRTIFLNRTCFNGLYRVNSKGFFNVPFGKYTNPGIVNENNLRAVSQALRYNPVSVMCRDFESILDNAREGDFVYFDPPYQPVSPTASFTSYTKQDFVDGGLARLADLCRKLDSKGCMVLLSNSDSEEVVNLFSARPWRTERIRTNRAINSNSKKRTGHFELLIKNY